MIRKFGQKLPSKMLEHAKMDNIWIKCGCVTIFVKFPPPPQHHQAFNDLSLYCYTVQSLMFSKLSRLFIIMAECNIIILMAYSKCLAMGADQLILTQCPIVIAYCLRAPKGSPSIPSDNVTELIEQVNRIMLERIR